MYIYIFRITRNTKTPNHLHVPLCFLVALGRDCDGFSRVTVQKRRPPNRDASLKCSAPRHATLTKSRPWLGTHREHRSAGGPTRSFRWHRMVAKKVAKKRKKKKQARGRTCPTPLASTLDPYPPTTERRRVRLFELLASQPPHRLEQHVLERR